MAYGPACLSIQTVRTISSCEGMANMNFTLRALVIRTGDFLLREDAQDLIEYGLLVALIALGATAGMNTVAADVNNVFTNVGGTLTSALA